MKKKLEIPRQNRINKFFLTINLFISETKSGRLAYKSLVNNEYPASYSGTAERLEQYQRQAIVGK